MITADILFERAPSHTDALKVVLTAPGFIGTSLVERLCKTSGEEITGLINEVARHAQDPTLRCAALECLAQRDYKSRHYLATLLFEPETRACAIAALGHANATESLPDILAFADNEDPAVRLSVVESMGLMRDERALEWLRKRAMRERLNPQSTLTSIEDAWLDHPLRQSLDPGTASVVLPSRGKTVLRALTSRDMGGLARQVHPIFGLRMGVSGQPRKKAFMPAEVRRFASDRTVHDWGTPGGSDSSQEETAFTFIQGLRTRELLTPDRIGYDTWIRDDGSSDRPRSFDREFPDGMFIQYVMDSGSDHNPGMWFVLLLVFQLHDADWKLVGIVENSWSP